MQPVGASFYTPGAGKRPISRGKQICHVGLFRGDFRKMLCDHFSVFQQIGILWILGHICAKYEMEI